MFVRVVLPGTAVPVAIHEGTVERIQRDISRVKKNKIKQTVDRRDRSKKERTRREKEKG